MTPEIVDLIDRSDDVFGGVEGDYLAWPYTDASVFRDRVSYNAVGVKPAGKTPEPGHLLAAEYDSVWVLFRVLEVTMYSEVRGLFDLKVEPIEIARKTVRSKPTRVVDRTKFNPLQHRWLMKE